MSNSSVLSPERQGHLARLITDGVWNDDLADYSDDDAALRVAKQAVVQFVKEETEIDEIAKQKVASLKRNVVEGSPEWDVMYRKYYEEERKRR